MKGLRLCRWFALYLGFTSLYCVRLLTPLLNISVWTSLVVKSCFSAYSLSLMVAALLILGLKPLMCLDWRLREAMALTALFQSENFDGPCSAPESFKVLDRCH